MMLLSLMFSCPLRGKRKVRSRGKRASQGRISGWLSYLKIGQPGIFISVYQVISVNSFALPAVKIPLARSRAPERLPKKEFALFEAQPSLQTPGSIEERRVSRIRRDKWRGAFSLVRFFGQAKK
jgi:hypothetical protein